MIGVSRLSNKHVGKTRINQGAVNPTPSVSRFFHGELVCTPQAGGGLRAPVTAIPTASTNDLDISSLLPDRGAATPVRRSPAGRAFYSRSADCLGKTRGRGYSSCPLRQLAAVFLSIVALFISPVSAQETRRVQFTDITIQDTPKAGALAEVVFENSSADSPEETDFEMTYRGLIVGVHVAVGWGAPDTIDVTPPDGVIAVPQSLTIADGTTATLHLYPLESVGF